MILQAYDFVELNRRYGCRLQMGGSDQWGNIVNGVELGRRMDQAELFGLTQPLITTSSGAKMGKTAQGAVWLNADMFSPYDYWQYWRNGEDADVGRFLKIFTDLPLEEIARLEALQGAEINDAKKVLATEATALLHGREEALKAEQAARATFEQGVTSENLPTITLSKDEFAGLRVAAALAKAGLVSSNGEGKRAIGQKSVSVNDTPVSDENATLGDADFVDGAIKLSFGRKKHALLRVS
jgi:tyrosyl-tRNA synthetase